jgi:hypothetical protein
MIVRIAEEGQYRMTDQHLDQLRQLDGQLVEAVTGGDEGTFGRLFAQLITYVRSNGVRLEDVELAHSDVILPPPDTTLEEARELFSGEGALPS